MLSASGSQMSPVMIMHSANEASSAVWTREIRVWVLSRYLFEVECVNTSAFKYYCDVLLVSKVSGSSECFWYPVTLVVPIVIFFIIWVQLRSIARLLPMVIPR